MENNAKKALQRATIEVVAEDGLHDFSMKRVTQRAGVSEALVYKHFRTKDNLLYCCYEDIHAEIGKMFKNLSLLTVNHSREELYGAVRLYWMIYFNFLVSHGNETIFYFTYRDSSHIKKVHASEESHKATMFKEFSAFFDLVDSQIHIYDKIPSEFLWCYILDTSGVFAKRVIRGELPNTPECFETIWRLVSGGILGCLEI